MNSKINNQQPACINALVSINEGNQISSDKKVAEVAVCEKHGQLKTNSWNINIWYVLIAEKNYEQTGC